MVRQLQMVAIRKDQRCYLVYALIARCVPFFLVPRLSTSTSLHFPAKLFIIKTIIFSLYGKSSSHTPHNERISKSSNCFKNQRKK